MRKKLGKEEDKRLQQELIENGPLPQHVAFIMDGNGRWAKKQGLPRIAGHNEGVKSVRAIVEAAGELYLKAVTLFAFSSENWKRPSWEVSALMKLLMKTIREEIDNLNTNNVKVTIIGDLDRLPEETLKHVLEARECTKNNTGLIMNLALSYGSRDEMVEVARNLARDAVNRKIQPEEITEEMFNGYLSTAFLPEPDLMVRTSGEFRLSNFLLWQLAYTEIYVTEKLWPDFRKKEFYEAIKDFQKRERRFGKISEQLTMNKMGGVDS